MKKVQDPIFGNMDYKYSWKKNENLWLWGHNITVTIVASDTDEEGINKTQQNAYKQVKNKIQDVIVQNFDLIVAYCNDAFYLGGKSKVEISSHITPKSVNFQRDGSWGILFDCDYDIDHGLVLYFENGKAFVGAQDDFL
ncbi:hypothetical protein [Maridesulfovibrio ferrireducens]|uniref:DUF6985 domain-containing protein n=1 Tax=Maridesulfovibrio ferrireducens TaxID=246191 RepID=UPI001A35660E|nr:hypothetical protein [Maridesulfovibrio ferrireducens]MBI9109966.1 hypothetical protein [Maridesulfovibrio ferrireducens]